jgi:hypothetical protein
MKILNLLTTTIRSVSATLLAYASTLREGEIIFQDLSNLWKKSPGYMESFGGRALDDEQGAARVWLTALYPPITTPQFVC